METIKLQYPIKRDNGDELSEVTVRRPLVRDYRIAQSVGGSNADRDVRLTANLCEISPSEVDKLDLADNHAIQEVIRGFLSRSAT